MSTVELGVIQGPAPLMRTDQVVQVGCVPCSPENLELYLQDLSGMLEFEPSGVVLAPGLQLSFDSYMNAFYEAYWIEFTDVSAVCFRLQGEGRLRCSVYRDHAPLGCALILKQDLTLDKDGSAGVEVELLSADRGLPGRLFVVVEALGRAVRITGCAWTTETPERRKVRLGVGICTFRREPFVHRTICRLLDGTSSTIVPTIVVVNQAEPIASFDIEALARRHGGRLKLIAQGNLGGAGGFTRAIVELLDAGETTHVLLMDDDVEVAPEHLLTAAAFLARANTPLVLGGQMLDLFRPMTMTEAGCRITPSNTLHANHAGLDLSQSEDRAKLGKILPSTYNGWWFSVIPLDALREHGLPMPLFIRGDDQELGVRLSRQGVTTVSLPPLSVWHEPFYAAPPGWRLYYDFRNRLIIAALYPDRMALDSPLRIAKTLLLVLARFDYQYAHFLLAGIKAFLLGPELLGEDCAVHHRTVLAAWEAVKPCLVEAPIAPSIATAPVLGSPRKVRWTMVGVVVRLLIGAPARTDTGGEPMAVTDMPLHLMRLGRRYVLTDPQEHYFIQFTYSRNQTWLWLLRALPLLWRFARARHQVAARWRAAAPGLVSIDAWRQRFANT